jgi:hypothetical protein
MNSPKVVSFDFLSNVMERLRNLESCTISLPCTVDEEAIQSLKEDHTIHFDGALNLVKLLGSGKSVLLCTNGAITIKE